MTRDQIVTYVTTATGYAQPDDVAACQQFVTARDRLIYDSALWKSSLVLCPVAVNPGNADNAAGLVILPPSIKRVVAMRTNALNSLGQGGFALRVHQLEHWFRIDYDRFSTTGTPWEFSLLPPIWTNIRLAAGAQLVVQLPAPGDANAQFKVVWRDSAGNRTSTISAAGAPTMNVVPAPGDGFVCLERVLKPVTQGTLIVTDGGANNYGTLQPADTTSPQCPVARLFDKPQQAITLNVLGKCRYDDSPTAMTTIGSLNFGSQEPSVANSETLLIALVRVDMLRRGGENGEAETALIECMGQAKDGHGGLMQALKDIEAIQEAANMRIDPDAGYGPDYGLGPLPLGFYV